MANKSDQLMADYIDLCRKLGDIDVAIETCKGVRTNLLIEAGKIQKELRKMGVENEKSSSGSVRKRS